MTREGPLETVAYHGPILAVEDLRDPLQMTIAVGMGPCMHFTNGEQSDIILTEKLFHHEHIHGLRLCPDDTLLVWATTLLVSGKVTRDVSGSVIGFIKTAQVDCEDWVLCALALGDHICASTMHNEMLVIDTTTATIIERLQAPSRAILYSSWIECLGSSKADIVVVGGSVRWTCPVWRPFHTAEFREMEVHQGSVFSVRVYDDEQLGPLVLSSSDDRNATLWRLNDGSVIGTYSGHGGRVWSALLCSDRIVTACEDAIVRLFDRKSGKCLRQFHGHRHGGHGVRALTISTSHTTLSAISAGEDASVKVWDISLSSTSATESYDKKCITLPPTHRKDWIRWLGFLNNSNNSATQICVVSNFGMVYTADSSARESGLRLRYVVEDAPVVAAGVSKTRLWFGLVSGGVSIIRKDTFDDLQTIVGAVEQQVAEIFPNTTTDEVVIVNRSGDVTLASEEGVVGRFRISGRKTCCCLVPGGFILLGTANGTVWVVHKDASSECRLFNSKVRLIAIEVKGRVNEAEKEVICSGNDGTVITSLWKATKDGQITLQPIYTVRVSAIQHLLGVRRPSPTAPRLAWGFSATDFLVWDVDSLVERWKVNCGGQRRPYALTFQEGKAIFVYADTAKLEFTVAQASGASWMTESSEFNGDHGRTIHGVCAVGADQMSFVTCSEDNSVKLYTPTSSSAGEDWRCVQTLDVHIGPVKCIASCGDFVISGGARSQWLLYRVVTSSRDGKLSLWVEDGGEMFSECGMDNVRLMAVAIGSHSPDNVFALFGDSSGSVWKAQGHPGKLHFRSTYTRHSACLAVIAPDAHQVSPPIAGYADGHIVRLNDKDCLSVHTAGVNALAWIDSGKLASSGDDQDVVITDVQRMIILKRISLAHLAGIHAMATAPSTKTIYSVGWDRRVKAWSVDDEELSLSGCTRCIATEPNAVAVLHHGHFIVVVGRGWQVLSTS